MLFRVQHTGEHGDTKSALSTEPVAYALVRPTGTVTETTIPATSYPRSVSLDGRTADEHAQILRGKGLGQVADALERFMAGSKEPRVLFHGTTHGFDSFDPTIRGNKEGHFGGGVVYLTTSTEDASRNYAGPGPDLISRIDNLADHLLTAWEYDGPEEYEGDDWQDLDREDQMEFAKKIAASDLDGGRANVMPVFARIENPIVIEPRGGTWIEFEFSVEEEDQEGLDALHSQIASLRRESEGDGIAEAEEESLLEAIDGIEVELEELEQEIEDRRFEIEPSGPGGQILQAARRLAVEYECVGFHDGQAELSMNLMEGAWAYDIDRQLRELFQYAMDLNGDLATTEAVAEVWKAAGYDAIVQDAYYEFAKSVMGRGRPMGGLTHGDKHVIIFDPARVKSATGCRTFNIESASLTGADVAGSVPAPTSRTPGVAERAQVALENADTGRPQTARATPR